MGAIKMGPITIKLETQPIPRNPTNLKTWKNMIQNLPLGSQSWHEMFASDVIDTIWFIFYDGVCYSY
jgi:hypothetical protein